MWVAQYTRRSCEVLAIAATGTLLLVGCATNGDEASPRPSGSSSQGSPSQAADGSDTKTKERTNAVTFDSPGNSTCCNVQTIQVPTSSVTAYSITPGQPWGGVTETDFAQQGENYASSTLTVNAGRSASTDVANWFNDYFTSGTKIYISANSGIDPGTPSQLNFAMNMNLVINGSSYPVLIGQGSKNNGDNNWWMQGQGFSSDCSSIGVNVMKTPDGKYLIGASNDSEFQIGTACSQISSNPGISPIGP